MENQFTEVKLTGKTLKQQVTELVERGLVTPIASIIGGSVLKPKGDVVIYCDGMKLASIYVPVQYTTDDIQTLMWDPSRDGSDNEWPIRLYQSTNFLVEPNCNIYRSGNHNRKLQVLIPVPVAKSGDSDIVKLADEIKSLKTEIDHLKTLLSKERVGEQVRDYSNNPSALALAKLPQEFKKYYDANSLTKLVTRSPGDLAYVHNQTHDVCLAAVDSDPFVIKYVHDQTPRLCDIAVRKEPSTLMYIVNQSTTLCKLAIDLDPNSIQYVRRPTRELIACAIERAEIKLTGGLVVNAVQAAWAQPNGCLENMLMDCLSHDYRYLAFIPNVLRTRKVITHAIKQDVKALVLLEDQAPFIELALNKSYEALLYIRNPTPDMYTHVINTYRKPKSSDNPTGFNHLPKWFINTIDMNIPMKIDDVLDLIKFANTK